MLLKSNPCQNYPSPVTNKHLTGENTDPRLPLPLCGTHIQGRTLVSPSGRRQVSASLTCVGETKDLSVLRILLGS